MKSLSICGAGIGLRFPHIRQILRELPCLPWMEVLTDNYLEVEGPAAAELLQVREHYPLTLHSVGMSLGSADPLDYTYLRKLKEFSNHLSPIFISDHLCWCSVHGVHSHDLLPLPYTEETVQHVSRRIRQVQEYLGRRILIENVSTYLNFRGNTLKEWEFVAAVATEADCFLLVDVNNIAVNAYNFGLSPSAYLKGLPAERVKQFHLAGAEEKEGVLIDTHNQPVSDPVWELYEEAVGLFGPLPTLIEWDNNLPSLERLMEEAAKAQDLLSGSAL